MTRITSSINSDYTFHKKSKRRFFAGFIFISGWADRLTAWVSYWHHDVSKLMWILNWFGTSVLTIKVAYVYNEQWPDL